MQLPVLVHCKHCLYGICKIYYLKISLNITFPLFAKILNCLITYYVLKLYCSLHYIFVHICTASLSRVMIYNNCITPIDYLADCSTNVFILNSWAAGVPVWNIRHAIKICMWSKAKIVLYYGRFTDRLTVRNRFQRHGLAFKRQMINKLSSKPQTIYQCLLQKSISIANALELWLCCTNQSICDKRVHENKTAAQSRKRELFIERK